MSADANEPDPPFGDESAGKPLRGSQQFGDLPNRQKPLNLAIRSPDHHAAFLLADRSLDVLPGPLPGSS